jgi:hypothetical protein
MAEEIFLNTTVPGFKAHEDDLIKQGFIEKKYTRVTQKEIEGALRRYILKQAVPGTLNTPDKVASFQSLVDSEIQKLYINSPSGDRYLKIKMYIPSQKLQKQREASRMAEEVAIEEEFAPENYGEMATLAEKAEDLTRSVVNKVSVLKSNSPVSKLNNAIENSAKVKARVIKMLPKVHAYPDVAARVGSAINTLTRAEAYSQALRTEYSRNVNALASLLESTNFGTRVQRRPNGSWIERPEYIGGKLRKTHRYRNTKRKQTRRKQTK